MSKTRYMMFAISASALAAVPAQAGGLLGGGLTAPVLGNGSIVGNIGGSVGKSLDLNMSRSIDPRGGSSATAGVAGSVSSVAGAALGANGLGQNIGLAGASSTNAATEKEAGIAVPGLGSAPARSLAANVRATASGAADTVTETAFQAGEAGGSPGAMIGASAAGALAAGQQVAGSPGSVTGSGSLAGTISSAANGALSAGKPAGGAHQASLAGTMDSAASGAGAISRPGGGSGHVGGTASLTGSLSSAANGALTIARGARSPGDGIDGASARAHQGRDKSARDRKGQRKNHSTR